MSSILPTDAQVVSACFKTGESGVTRPDFHYWHQVFDQAHSRGLHAGRSGHEESRQSAVPESPSPCRETTLATAQLVSGPHLPQTACSASSVSAVRPDLPADFFDEQGPLVSIADANDVLSARGACGAGRATTWQAPAAVVADAAAQAPQLAPRSRDTQIDESRIQAHVMWTESGDLKVALRAQRGLSVSQALAAAAQAAAGHGASDVQVEQVVLNGERIYQNTSKRPVMTGASAPFEMKC